MGSLKYSGSSGPNVGLLVKGMGMGERWFALAFFVGLLASGGGIGRLTPQTPPTTKTTTELALELHRRNSARWRAGGENSGGGGDDVDGATL